MRRSASPGADIRSLRLGQVLIRGWTRVGPRLLPFADVATPELPLGRLLRLALFQVSVGMAAVLLTGTLNRVMIVELGAPAWLVALVVSLPLAAAPFRALLGFRSDHHRSAIGWRRVPYIWMGTLLQFGGLAVMPFALLALSAGSHGPVLYGRIGAGLAFLLVGAGMHTTQTAGLALASDLAPAAARPRVVALLYFMLLAGTLVSALAFGALLRDFSELRLIRVIQGAALLTMALNLLALWKQEARRPRTARAAAPPVAFRAAWRRFARGGRTRRLLAAVGLGTAGFSMQDVLLEPYGGQIMGLSVSETTGLTALTALGAIAAFALAARLLRQGGDPCRLAAWGALAGVAAFAAIVFSAPLDSTFAFRAGAALIGFGGGLFSVSTLTAAMSLDQGGEGGLVLGAWGAVQASAAGIAVALGGVLRDAVSGLASHGALGEALAGPATGYSFVYHLEIALLFATLVAIGPLVRTAGGSLPQPATGFGLSEFPG